MKYNPRRLWSISPQVADLRLHRWSLVMSNGERADRVRQAAAEYAGKVASGHDVSADAWAFLHADLMPELAAELKKVQLLGAACQIAMDGAARAGAADASNQSTLSLSGTDGRALHVRCPHCHNPVQVADDTPFIDIGCNTCGSSFSLLRDTYATPTVRTLGHFELVERLGTGGFGTVWKARDTQLDRTVAIKIPREGRLASVEFEQSFFREARAAAQLKHPGIVSVHEVGRQDDTIYIASEYVESATLADWISAHPPTPRAAAELMTKVAESVQHAHEHGVIHRDLKPANILIDARGNPHITDFGLAKRAVGEITMTVEGQILGTPAYISPEQARGEGHGADARSDVFSLGIILFQLLAGRLPYEGSRAMLLMDIMHQDPPRPRSIRKSIPRDLETICLKCLEKRPENRYQTAQEFLDDLQRFLQREPIRARRPSVGRRIVRLVTRNPRSHLKVLLAFLGGLAAASVFGLSLVVFFATNAKFEAPKQSDYQGLEQFSQYRSGAIEVKPTYRIVLANESAPSGVVPLTFGGPEVLPVRLMSNSALPDRLRLKVQYDNDRISVKDAQGAILAAGEVREISVGTGNTATEHRLDLRLEPRDQRGGQTSFDLIWLDRNDRALAQQSVSLAHPAAHEKRH